MCAANTLVTIFQHAGGNYALITALLLLFSYLARFSQHLQRMPLPTVSHHYQPPSYNLLHLATITAPATAR